MRVLVPLGAQYISRFNELAVNPLLFLFFQTVLHVVCQLNRPDLKDVLLQLTKLVDVNHIDSMGLVRVGFRGFNFLPVLLSY
jgi:hypothetical protein